MASLDRKFCVDPRLWNGKEIVYNDVNGKQKKFSIQAFAKGKHLDVLQDFEIQNAVADGVPIDGHFLETKGYEGELRTWVSQSSAKVKDIKFTRVSINFKPNGKKVAAASSAPVSAFQKLSDALGIEKAFQIGSKTLKQLETKDYYKIAVEPLGLDMETATAEDVYNAVRAK